MGGGGVQGEDAWYVKYNSIEHIVCKEHCKFKHFQIAKLTITLIYVIETALHVLSCVKSYMHIYFHSQHP